MSWLNSSHRGFFCVVIPIGCLESFIESSPFFPKRVVSGFLFTKKQPFPPLGFPLLGPRLSAFTSPGVTPPGPSFLIFLRNPHTGVEPFFKQINSANRPGWLFVFVSANSLQRPLSPDPSSDTLSIVHPWEETRRSHKTKFFLEGQTSLPRVVFSPRTSPPPYPPSSIRTRSPPR